MPDLITPDRTLLEALADVSAALARCDPPGMIVGDVAVAVRGVGRRAMDVAGVVWAEGLDVARLLRLFEAEHVAPRDPEAAEFATLRHVLLLSHEPTATPVEIGLGWLPFEREALDRSTLEEFGHVRIRVATPEDLIVYKAVAWRDRDRADIERLFLLHGASVNLSRIRSLVAALSDALGERARVVEFDRLTARSLGRP